MGWVTVLDLGALRIEMRVRPSYFDRWFDCRLVVDASPFGGTLEEIFTGEDLVAFADSLDAFDPEGEAVLGGDRAAELRLIVANQVGGREGSLAVECSLARSGDDPYPYIRWLVFDSDPFAAPTSQRLRELASTDPWPSP